MRGFLAEIASNWEETTRAVAFGAVALLIVAALGAALGNDPSAWLLYALPVGIATGIGRWWSGAALAVLTSGVLWVQRGAGASWVGMVEQSLSLIAVVLVFHFLFERSHWMATHDPVTGLLNRRGAEEDGCALVESAIKRKRSLVAIVVDCDHFKAVNDQYGHLTGDRVLHAVARALASNIRRPSIACRVGGDEFVILLMGADSACSNRYLEVVRRNLSRESRRLPLTPSISAGVAVLGRNGTTYKELFSAADLQMFRNKQLARHYDRAAANIRAATISA